MDATTGFLDKARLLASDFASRAEQHDREASFPFENFEKLFEAGLLSLTVARGFCGHGAGAREVAKVLGLIAEGDAATALVLAMHYIQHFMIARNDRFPLHLAKKLSSESNRGVALINALRVEPDLGSPARGGLPATTARKMADGWRISGHKIYSTGAPILKYYVVWAKTDEPQPRVGSFLVPAGLPGIRIVETWDHLGQRASGSHDAIFDDVGIPLNHEIDVRLPEAWKGPDVVQNAIHSIFVAAIYDGIARSAKTWLVNFLKARKPANLGASLATLPRVQEIVGDIEVRLAINARLIESVASDQDDGRLVTVAEAHAVKLTVTGNAIAVVEAALSLSGNHGLSRTNPLERHYRDVLCGRIHTPQDDSIKTAAGRAVLQL
ncbi:acyl-CoA dehydrogenase family protein [Bradyrhizobium sp. LHD-71]|uniref:acyl-CoA dehydrogenase family protein n=1 Tax=Bradyrhizobium sp. LHD-71 TaxID=3072141 RepID=UPI00280C6F26|nr:acyl-CoA dehydrogenase family protein [Bradyrhizobium sp. LHD-71]MDQ8730868.1 acyl-CoA dehydrogenase family protein [Bradyrhizobium sp. LHD-71]